MSELSGQDERNRESAAAGQADDSRAQNQTDTTAAAATVATAPAAAPTTTEEINAVVKPLVESAVGAGEKAGSFLLDAAENVGGAILFVFTAGVGHTATEEQDTVHTTPAPEGAHKTGARESTREDHERVKHAGGGIEAAKRAMREEGLHENRPMAGRGLGLRKKAKTGIESRNSIRISPSDGTRIVGRFKTMTHLRNPKSIRPSARRLFSEGKRLLNARSGRGTKGCNRASQASSILGHVEAQAWLGAAYDYGLGVKQNRRIALKHYRVAADAGNANAQYHVGVFYHDGTGVRKNYQAAVSWLRKAIKQGDAEAMYLLGDATAMDSGYEKVQRKGSSCNWRLRGGVFLRLSFRLEFVSVVAKECRLTRRRHSDGT